MLVSRLGLAWICKTTGSSFPLPETSAHSTLWSLAIRLDQRHEKGHAASGRVPYIYIYIYCCKCLVQCKSELHDQDSIWIVLNHLGEKPIRSTAIRAVSLLRLQLVFGMLPGCWRCLAPRPPAKPSFAVVGDDCELLDHLCRDACRGHKRAKAKASSRILASVTLCRQQRFVTSIFATYIWSTGRQRAQDKSHANPAWSVRWKR